MIEKINGQLSSNISMDRILKDNNNKKVTSFADTLKNYIKSVNDDQINANKSIEKFLRGEEKDIHNTMISIEKADISLQLFTQIRNKVIDAYKELMRIQI